MTERADGDYVLYSDAQAELAERDREIAALNEEINRDHRRLGGKDKEIAALRALYNELIMEVQNKFPDESRHETARRYIRERENTCYGPAQAGKEAP
jgi:chromosome segregation ATPase